MFIDICGVILRKERIDIAGQFPTFCFYIEDIRQEENIILTLSARDYPCFLLCRLALLRTDDDVILSIACEEGIKGKITLLDVSSLQMRYKRIIQNKCDYTADVPVNVMNSNVPVKVTNSNIPVEVTNSDIPVNVTNSVEVYWQGGPMYVKVDNFPLPVEVVNNFSIPVSVDNRRPLEVEVRK